MNVRFTTLLVLAAVGLLAVTPLLAACGSQEPGQVEGRVIDARDKPVPALAIVVYTLEKSGASGGVDVFQKGVVLEEAATDADGRYTLSLEPGRYLLRVRQGKFEVAEQMVQVNSGITLTADFQIAAGPEG